MIPSLSLCVGPVKTNHTSRNAVTHGKTNPLNRPWQPPFRDRHHPNGRDRDSILTPKALNKQLRRWRRRYLPFITIETIIK